MKKVMGKIDNEKLNDTITLFNKILKILFYVIVLGIIYLLFGICKDVGVFSFLLKVLKISAPLFIGFVLAWLFNPIVSYLNTKNIKRIWGSAIVYVVFIGLLYLLLRLVIPTLADQVNDLINVIPTVFNEIKDFILDSFDSLSKIKGLNIVEIKQNILNTIESSTTALAVSLPNLLIMLVTSLFSGIGTLALALIIGFYLLLNFDSANEHLLSLLPKKNRYETRALISEVSVQLRKYVNGTLVIAGIVSITCSIGFAIVGLKAPILFGIFCGITNIIPYAGPYIGGAPAVLVGFSQGGAVGILVLIIVAIVQTIEGNLLQPIIMSKTMKLHPVTIVFGLIVFGYFFGIYGMILATPIIALLKIIINFFVAKYDLFDYDDQETEIIDLNEIRKRNRESV